MVGSRGVRRDKAEPLFGRAELLEDVGRSLERVRQGHGEGVLLTGPGGSGKSRVLRAVVDRALGQGFWVLSGRALPEELPGPFSLVQDLLRTPGESAAVPELWADTGHSLFLAPVPEEPLGSPPSPPSEKETLPAFRDELDRILAPVGSTSIEGLGASREEMLGRLIDNFRALAGQQPLLIAIDDLQFADASSLELLRRLAGEIGRIPALVVATVGTAAEIPDAARAPVAALSESATFRSVPLRPLTVLEMTEFIRWILGGRNPDPQDVLRWHAQTEGNPLFIEQLVRAVTGSDPRGPAAAAQGRDVTEMLTARVRELGESERRVLTYAAVLGKEFDFPSLAAVAGMEEERVTESLDHLVQRGLLRERGEEVYEFVTEAVRANVYASLTETRRRILHRKAGQALAAKGGATDAELARQFYLGRDDVRAVEYNLRAAQNATRAFAFETAVAHLERAVQAERRGPSPNPRRQIRLLTDEGRLLDELGNTPRSEEVLREAVALARGQPGLDLELGKSLLGLAQTLSDRSEYLSAEALANEATIVLEKVGSSRDLLAAHRVLGVVFWRRGELAPAEAHQRAALEIAEREGTPIEQGHALVDIANTMVPLGATRLGTALELYARAAELFATVEDQGARARVLMNRAVLEYGAGRTEDALRDMAVAIETADRSRSPIWIGFCHVNLAQWLAELGRPSEARPALERAVHVLTPLGDRLAEQQLAMTRGMVSLAEGSLGAAEDEFQDALDRARALRLGSEVPEMWFRLAEVAYRAGDLDGARERLAEAEKMGLLEQRPDLTRRHAELARALRPPS